MIIFKEDNLLHLNVKIIRKKQILRVLLKWMIFSLNKLENNRKKRKNMMIKI